MHIFLYPTFYLFFPPSFPLSRSLFLDLSLLLSISLSLSLFFSLSISIPPSHSLPLPLFFSSQLLHASSSFYRRLVSVDINSGMAMQSAAKCPFLLSFTTEPWDGPDEIFRSHNSQLGKSTHLQTSYG